MDGSGVDENRVYFMEEKGDWDDAGSYFCKPYLTTGFDTKGEKPPEHRQILGMMHKYPIILALGIMLIQIATGEPTLVDQGHPDEWPARLANEQLRMVNGLLETKDFEHDCRMPAYKNAVQKCLDLKLFKDMCQNECRRVCTAMEQGADLHGRTP